MTLPASGALSVGAINTELGRAAGATTSLGETATRNLAGVPSGAVRFSDLYGQTNGAPPPTFSPLAGSYTDGDDGTNTFTITCSAPAVWTWTRTGSSLGTANVASGGTASSITFSISTTTVDRTSTFTVTGTSGGVTARYTINLTAWGNSTQ